MNVIWAIEDHVWHDKDLSELKEVISSLSDCDYVIGESIPFEDKDIFQFLAKEECVIFYGSLETAQKIRRTKPWIPGLYYNQTNYFCTSYYPYYGELLVNSNYIMLPYGELLRKKDFLYETLGEDNTIFMRPNAGNKIFTGKTVYYENFEKDLDYFGFYNVDKSELVVIAKPQQIIDEARFVVANNEIITGSLYRIDKDQINLKLENEDESHKKYINFANEVLEQVLWRPDNVWVLDVCSLENNELKVMEIGCFSCAGLYDCDKKTIIEKVSEIARNEYREYQA